MAKEETVLIRFEVDEKALYKAVAEQEGRTVSGLIRHALEQYLISLVQHRHRMHSAGVPMPDPTPTDTAVYQWFKAKQGIE